MEGREPASALRKRGSSAALEAWAPVPEAPHMRVHAPHRSHANSMSASAAPAVQQQSLAEGVTAQSRLPAPAAAAASRRLAVGSLEDQLLAVQQEIVNAEVEIRAVGGEYAETKRARNACPEGSGRRQELKEELDTLSKKEVQLRKKEEQLRKKEEQLREQLLLIERQRLAASASGSGGAAANGTNQTCVVRQSERRTS